MNDIKNINWINDEENITFNTNGSSASFIIDGEKVLNNIRIDFDVTNGEISYKDNGEKIEGKIYIRSVNKDNLIIWYDRAEYKLNRKIINE